MRLRSFRWRLNGEAAISETIDGKMSAPAGMVIAATRRAEREAMVGVIESCRSYLLRVAERAPAPDLKAKEAAADLVQEALVEARREAGRWSGRSPRRRGRAPLGPRPAPRVDAPGRALAAQRGLLLR
jgi:hypothetical protein